MELDHPGVLAHAVATSSTRVRCAVAVAGAATLLAQVVLLRETLASSHGNELVLGLALAAWLALTGLASAIGARFGGSAAGATQRLATLLALAPLAFLGALWLSRYASSGLAEDPSMARVLVAAVVAFAPASGVGGLAFAWAAAAEPVRGDGVGIYAADTVGAALGGLAFHFLFAEYLPASWILLVAGAAAAVAGVALLWPNRRLVVLAAVAVAGAVAIRAPVEKALTAARFPGEQVLAVEPSRYGLAAVIARGEQKVFFHDGVLLFTSEDQIATEEITHFPLLLHPHPRRILMIGGGLGGGLAQALAHHPEVLDYAEIDPALPELARAYADPATRAALADPTVHTVTGDARALLRTSPGRYDVILVSLPIPQNALAARLSTRECLEEARRALAPDGLLVLVTPGSDTYLDPAARLRHASLWATVSAVFPSVGVAPGSQTVLWAPAGGEVQPELLASRLAEREIRPLHIGRAWLFDRLLRLHAESYRRRLAGTVAVQHRDFRPVVYLFGLLENLERLSPRLARAALVVVQAQWAPWAVAAGFAVVIALCSLLGRGRRAGTFAAAAAGATGMTVELVLLLAFQALAGHLYHAIGLLIAVFMAGLAAGAWLGRRMVGRRGLAWTLGLTALVVALLPPVLWLLPASTVTAGLAVAGALALVGACTGAVYPLAVRAAGEAGAVARVWAWDLAGAAGAAALVSLLAVPLLGLFPVTWLAAALCGTTALANLADARSRRRLEPTADGGL